MEGCEGRSKNSIYNTKISKIKSANWKKTEPMNKTNGKNLKKIKKRNQNKLKKIFKTNFNICKYKKLKKKMQWKG